MINGFMFLHRKLLDWEWFDNSNMVHVWIYLLLKANYQDDCWHGIKIPRGSLITSVSCISKDTGLSIQNVRTCLNKLKLTGELTIKVTNNISIVTICKYDDYNVLENETNKRTNKQTNNEVTTSNNNIEDNNKEKDTNVSKKKKTMDYSAEFVSDWNLYERKGSKKDSYSAWKDLSADDKIKMRSHIPHYLQSNERQYRKDFERYIKHRTFDSPVYKGSVLLYDPMKVDNPEEYHPLTDDIFQTWNEERKCLMFNGDLNHLYDGYADDNRPDGAMVSWGMYSWKWNKQLKQWVEA